MMTKYHTLILPCIIFHEDSIREDVRSFIGRCEIIIKKVRSGRTVQSQIDKIRREA